MIVSVLSCCSRKPEAREEGAKADQGAERAGVSDDRIGRPPRSGGIATGGGGLASYTVSDAVVGLACDVERVEQPIERRVRDAGREELEAGVDTIRAAVASISTVCACPPSRSRARTR